MIIFGKKTNKFIQPLMGRILMANIKYQFLNHVILRIDTSKYVQLKKVNLFKKWNKNCLSILSFLTTI